MKNQFAKLVSFLSLVALVAACSKDDKKELTPTSGGINRGTLIRNIPLRSDLMTALQSQGLPNGVCAQLMVPNSGSQANVRVIEISAGACPSSLVDDTRKNVFRFAFTTVGSSNEYQLNDLEYNERAGKAEWSSFADRNNRNVTQLNTLCSHNDDLCYIDMSRGDLHIEMY